MGELIGLVAVSAPFLMVLGIVWINNQKKLEERRIAATAEASSEKAAQYASKVQALEDRVRVLERIVTDQGYNVASQIEALRDQRNVDEANAGVQIEFAKKEEV
ncbi:hypothetical protein [Aurantiacibacter gilvus]|uniref:Uncharacterized protein n=1 Tax=Aurantiacibacter gilvus TaxID=3139141 RepID=A0ABU9IB10_9SPHN